MEQNFSLDTLAAAEVCFAEASRLLYDEPSYESVARQVVTQQFADAPFAMDNTFAHRGLARMDEWCSAALAEAREAAVNDASAPTDEASLAEGPLFRERVDALRREWLRLFVGLGTPEASCLESYYVEPNSHMFGKNTLAVRSAYKAHGLQIERLHSEPDDHLGLMLGFVSHLIGEECQAADEGKEADRKALVSDQEAFMADHMLPWLAAWRYSVEKYAVSDYFSGLGDFVFGLVARYVERFGIRFDDQDQRFLKTA